ncbi:hypothetical protein BDW59DRAFT_29418 [Aspergillus cavernicola]|uniref:Uncharacterized protein n=1 Tax=Aspergillus cavernicola TaxID=176166 RepID=A0ABR4IQG7_9EURO
MRYLAALSRRTWSARLNPTWCLPMSIKHSILALLPPVLQLPILQIRHAVEPMNDEVEEGKDPDPLLVWSLTLFPWQCGLGRMSG